MSEEIKWRRWHEFGVRGEKDGCWIIGYFEYDDRYICGKGWTTGVEVFRSGIVYRPDYFMLLELFDPSMEDARMET